MVSTSGGRDPPRPATGAPDVDRTPSLAAPILSDSFCPPLRRRPRGFPVEALAGELGIAAVAPAACDAFERDAPARLAVALPAPHSRWRPVPKSTLAMAQARGSPLPWGPRVPLPGCLSDIGLIIRRASRSTILGRLRCQRCSRSQNGIETPRLTWLRPSTRQTARYVR